MNIVKTFTNGAVIEDINIQGSVDDLLFEALQIAKLLKVVNIQAVMADFDSDETCVMTGNDTVFLTELGLYRLLWMTKKPVTHKLRKWVMMAMREIRQNAEYELRQTTQRQIKHDQQEYEITIKRTRQNILVEANRANAHGLELDL